jgi:Mn-containing catalase
MYILDKEVMYTIDLNDCSDYLSDFDSNGHEFLQDVGIEELEALELIDEVIEW